MREAMSALAREVIASHEARATGLASIRQDVSAHRERARRQIQDLEGTRRATSRTLHSHLARGRTELARNEGRRKSGVRRWLADVAATRTRHAAQARTILMQSRAALEEATARSRNEARASLKELASARGGMARHLRDDLAQAAAQRRSDVRGWLGELASERLAAGQEWGQIATALRGREAGVIAPEAPAPMPSEKGFAALRDRVFAYLADHPDGVRFVEVEQQFRLDSQQASSVLRSLVEDGKAKRAGRLYLAA